MATVSLCMIVKNEERVLRRCLDSVKDLVDEIVIVDTGSTDSTREIAREYTQKVYDFVWIQDFSAARNFAFSKATCEYIYTADADEVIDEENREKFRILKESLLPEVEIVQMYYGNQLSFGTIYNYDKELRPKLFKRLREFEWIEPIHETIRLTPVIYDSEIVITHLPEQSHTQRDLAAFERQIEAGKVLSERLRNIYAKELFVSGAEEDFLRAEAYFTELADNGDLLMEQFKEALCVIVKAAAIRGDIVKFFRYAMKDVASEGVSEICYELGEFYLARGEYEEAAMWYYNAVYEAQSILNIHSGGDWALEKLALCYEKAGCQELACEYVLKAREWTAE